jgi:hypothetical protein
MEPPSGRTTSNDNQFNEKSQSSNDRRGKQRTKSLEPSKGTPPDKRR